MDIYPLKRNEDTCPSWRDCGQQYYIRLGWIKAKKRRRCRPRKQWRQEMPRAYSGILVIRTTRSLSIWTWTPESSTTVTVSLSDVMFRPSILPPPVTSTV